MLLHYDPWRDANPDDVHYLTRAQEKFLDLPGARFNRSRRQQAHGWPDHVKLFRLLVSFLPTDQPIRDRCRQVYRGLRQVGYHLSWDDLYRPLKGLHPVPSLKDMDTSDYWFDEAEHLEKQAHLLYAAADTYEYLGQQEKANEYFQAAAACLEGSYEAKGAAINLAAEEEAERRATDDTSPYYYGGTTYTQHAEGN